MDLSSKLGCFLGEGAGYRGGDEKIGKLGKLMGLTMLFPAIEPFPLEGTMGMVIAVCMLQRSLKKGRYRDTL